MPNNNKNFSIVFLYIFIALYILLLAQWYGHCMTDRCTTNQHISNKYFANRSNRLKKKLNPVHDTCEINKNNISPDDLYVASNQSFYDGEKYDNQYYIKRNIICNDKYWNNKCELCNHTYKLCNPNCKLCKKRCAKKFNIIDYLDILVGLRKLKRKIIL